MAAEGALLQRAVLAAGEPLYPAGGFFCFCSLLGELLAERQWLKPELSLLWALPTREVAGTVPG